MDSETRASVALLIYAGALTLAIVFAVVHLATSAVWAVVALGLATTVVFLVGPTLLRLLSGGRH